MCTDCNGLGTRPEMDPDLHRPGPDAARIRDGAIEPWASGMNRGEGWTAGLRGAAGQGASRSTSTCPARSCRKREKDVLMYGSERQELHRGVGRAAGSYKMEWEGLVHKLMRSFKTTHVRGACGSYYLKFFTRQALPRLQGRAPAAGEPRGEGRTDADASSTCRRHDHRRGAATFLDELPLSRAREAKIAAGAAQGDPQPPGLPARRRPRLPHARPHRAARSPAARASASAWRRRWAASSPA